VRSRGLGGVFLSIRKIYVPANGFKGIKYIQNDISQGRKEL
jgi:hypothetical protein